AAADAARLAGANGLPLAAQTAATATATQANPATDAATLLAQAADAQSATTTAG
ncbi:MAG TPA: flagellar hook-length control protein FliK, partial [Cupriavidus sp.]|nr:flagellar hook-length control protein FliK [Cupriavidus sp.]